MNIKHKQERFMFLCDTLQSNEPKPRSDRFSRFSPFICVAVKCLATCICMEWTSAKYRGQNSELTAREALSQSIKLKSFRGVHYRALDRPVCTDRQCAWPAWGVECTVLTNSPRLSLNTLPCPCYYPFFTSNCSVMVIVRSTPWRNYLQLT